MSTMKIGSKGKDVVRLQEALVRAKVKPAIEADGIYGKDTAAAVKSFQKKCGLKADGIAGGSTMECLGKGGKTKKASDLPQFDIPDMKPIIRAQQSMLADAVKSHDRRIKVCRLTENPVIEQQIKMLEISRQNHIAISDIIVGHAKEIEHLRAKFKIVDGKDAKRAAKFVAQAKERQNRMSNDQYLWERQVADKAEMDRKITQMVKELNR
ncbi:MAG: peptidoglycan-binding domain-containing protein [Pseudomonadota bacterium]